jgi:predicted DNA-binding transcriptional regulator AlpA
VVVAQGPTDGSGTDSTESQLERLCQMLKKVYRADTVAAGGMAEVRLPIGEADPVHNADQAAHQGRVFVADALRQVGLKGWEVGYAEALPELLGTREITDLLGLSRQRLHELRASGRFPRPSLELASGPVWLRSVVETFEERWDRRPGRRKRFLVQHLDMNTGRSGTNWFNDFDTLDEAQVACDGVWTGDDGVRQEITDAVSGERWIRAGRAKWSMSKAIVR